MTRRMLFLAVMGLMLQSAAAAAQGRWTSAAPMPSARSEVAVAAVEGKIYMVGGFRGERDLEIFDTASGRWSRGATIPRAVHHAAAVGWHGKL